MLRALLFRRLHDADDGRWCWNWNATLQFPCVCFEEAENPADIISDDDGDGDSIADDMAGSKSASACIRRIAMVLSTATGAMGVTLFTPDGVGVVCVKIN